MTIIYKLNNSLTPGAPKLSELLKIAERNPKTYYVEAVNYQNGVAANTQIARFIDKNQHTRISLYDNKTGEILHSAHTYDDFAIDKLSRDEFKIIHMSDPEKNPFYFKAKDFSDFVNWIKTMLTAIKS